MNNGTIALGIDIGGTNTKMGVFSQEGKLLAFKAVSSQKNISPELFIEQLARVCQQELLDKLKLKLGDSQIIGLGAGAPMANYFTGVVENAPNLGWKNVPLKQLFQDKFKCTSLIENDANLAAVGENTWGAGKDLKDFILITLGTGVGTGIILNGKLYRGHKGLGGEGGHIIIPHQKIRPCSCGGSNHLESFLSAKGIKETIFEMTGEEWPLEKLNTLFQSGDNRAIQVIEQIAFELALGLTSMGVLLGPEAIILGGGVSALGLRFNLKVKEKLEELIHFSLKDRIMIMTASLSSGQGAIYGGAALILDEVN